MSAIATFPPPATGPISIGEISPNVPEKKNPSVLQVPKGIICEPDFLGHGYTFWDPKVIYPEMPEKIEMQDVMIQSAIGCVSMMVRPDDPLKGARVSGDIIYDHRVCQALWDDYRKSHRDSCLEWLYSKHRICNLYISGATFRSPAGCECVVQFIRSVRTDSWQVFPFWTAQVRMTSEEFRKLCI